MSAAEAKPVIPPLSAERQQVERRMREMAVGEKLDWHELEALTGKPRDVVCRLVRDGRRRLESEHKLHFRTVVGSGVERISFQEAASETLPSQRKRIVGSARRMVRTSRNIPLESLDQSERASVLAHQTLGLLVEASCSNKGAKLLEAEMKKDNLITPLTPREAMARVLAK